MQIASQKEGVNIKHSPKWEKIIFVNTCSLRKNHSNLENEINSLETKPAVCAVQETWLPSAAQETIKGYKVLISKLRSTTNPNAGGGVGIFIREDIKHEVIETNFEPREFEVQSVYLEQLNSVIINVYKPPTTPTKNFLDKLTLLIKKIKNTHKEAKIIAGGDYNIDVLKDNNNKQELQLAAIEMGLTPIIEEPTRIGSTTTTCIDNILTNVRNYKSGVLPWSVADHLPIFIQITKKDKKENQQQKSRDLSTRALAYFLELNRKSDWKEVLEDDTKNCFLKFHEKLQESLDIACPVIEKKDKTNKNNDKKEPWMSNGLMISRKTKTKLLKKTIMKPHNQNHRTKYRTIQQNLHEMH
jgi:hypothetical protein